MFFSPDGENVSISTCTANLPGPVLNFPNLKYPRTSTGQKYIINQCQHNFQHVKFQQIRRGDEAPSSILECSICKIVITK